MDIGGPLAGFRQPLMSGDPASTSRSGASSSTARTAPRVRAKDPLSRGDSIHRSGTPLRSVDARSSMKRALNPNQCYAMCVAGAFDLLGIEAQLTSNATSSNSSSTNNNGGPTPRAAASLRGTAGPSEIRFVHRFSTGDDIVLRLQVCGTKDVFLFRFGALVCWSLEKREQDALKDWLRSFMQRELAVEDIEEEQIGYERGDLEAGDAMDEGSSDSDNEGGPKKSPIRNEQIVLTTEEPLEQLAHSYALAQSVRLGVFEITVSKAIDRTRSIPEQMAATGEVALDPHNLSKEMGGLLMLRCDVNLHTDILDTPEIFWDEEKFEPHYVACRKHLDIDKRVEILNQRLGVLKDMYDLLQNSMNVKHGNKLEWIVIVLILLEVVLELLELLHDAWAK